MRRSRSGGTLSVSTFRRKNRSSRNRPPSRRPRGQYSLVRSAAHRCATFRFRPGARTPALARRAGVCSAPSERAPRLRPERSCRCRRARNARASARPPRECTLLVTEQFALNKLRWQAGAIDFQVWRIAPRAQFMNEAREIILAGPALAGNQKGCRRSGYFLCQFERRNDAGSAEIHGNRSAVILKPLRRRMLSRRWPH